MPPPPGHARKTKPEPYCDGLIVLRKRQPLTKTRVRALLAGGLRLPEMNETDKAQVSEVIAQIRRDRRRRTSKA